MARASELSVDRLSAVLWTTCRNRWFMVVLSLYLVSSIVALGAPRQAFTSFSTVLTPVLFGIVAGQLVIARRGVRDRREQRFWRDFNLALVAWTLVAVIEAVSTLRTPLTGMMLDLGHWLVFTLLLAAAEHHPHLHGAWRPSTAEHRVRWPSVAILVTGWTFYFVGLPRLMWNVEPPPRTVFLGGLTLGGLVALRYTLLARRANIWRWRRLYDLLAVAMSAALVADIVAGWSLLGTATPVPRLARLSLHLAPVVVSFAIALSQQRLSPRLTAEPATSGLARLAGGQAGVLAAWALLVPAIHGVLHGLGWLDPAAERARSLLVILGVASLGAAAVLEHHLRRRRLLAARDEQRRVEDALRTREQDLRLILERRRGRDALRRSEEQFASAFRSSPDGLAISTLDEGRILDVNPSFERIVGRQAADMVGALVADLELWPGLDRRERIIHLVRRDGSVRDAEATLQVDGQTVRWRLSFEAIQVGADALLLTVVRDRTVDWLNDRPLARRAGLLDRAAASVQGVGADGRTTYRNHAAEGRRGTPASPSFDGRIEIHLDADPSSPPATQTTRLLVTDERSSGARR